MSPTRSELTISGFDCNRVALVRIYRVISKRCERSTNSPVLLVLVLYLFEKDPMYINRPQPQQWFLHPNLVAFSAHYIARSSSCRYSGRSKITFTPIGCSTNNVIGIMEDITGAETERSSTLGCFAGPCNSRKMPTRFKQPGLQELL